MDVGLIITGIKGTIATAKTAFELSKQMDNLELRQTLMKLSEELLDVQAKVIDLREEVSDLKEKAKTKDDLSKLKLKDEVLVDPGLPGVAYCLKCREDKKVKSVMTEQDAGAKYKSGKNYICNGCNHIAGVFVYETPVIEDHTPIRHPLLDMQW